MRITEKIKKGGEPILKHTSGTVEGWELDVADRPASTATGAADQSAGTAAEILLKSLPKVILVRFD